jgi:hypothetical protein
MLALLLACAEPADPAVDASSCETGQTYVGVLSSLTFSRAEDGISDGFDLDGAVTSAGGSTGCGVADYTSPAGVPGVDNGFALLVPALEATEASAVEGLIQDSINSGALLLAFELSGVDDLADDPCVGFTIERAVGAPLLGTDGTLEWDQTFARDPAVAPYTVSGLPLVGGYVEARPMVLDLPISVLDVDLVFHMDDAAFGIHADPDGSFRGVFAGGVDKQALLDILYYENVDPNLGPALEGLLAYASDLDQDGDDVCEQIAMTFQFTAIPAFLFEE